jgi:predicted membrane channel-forming protein YqfA (hemolysin III family)
LGLKLQGAWRLKKKVRISLIVCSAVLGLFAVALAVFIWQSTPFFDMNLVFLDAVIAVITAVLYAIAVMSPETKRG